MSDAHWATTTVGAQFIADAAAILDDETGPALAVTIAGTVSRGIVMDTFSEVEDPRAPEVLVKHAELDSVTRPFAVVLNGIDYYCEGYQPVGPGLAVLKLRLDP